MTAKQIPTIFVQIASYRDPELVPTLDNLFKQAAMSARIHVGICWQYKPGEDAPQPQTSHKNIRWRTATHEESEGVCWARHETQKLYKGEDYVLMIDSHMRFVKDWDKKLIEELGACASDKAVISHHPPGYAPPDKLDSNPRLTVLRPQLPTQSGEIRLRGETLDSAPPKPLRGAFAAPGFLFARAALIEEVPYDPYLYFEQEELCLSARLFTHGWDVYHPRSIFAYHLYDTMPAPYVRHKHWTDNPQWVDYNRRAQERREHLLGYKEATSEDALRDLDLYGQGDARSLEEYSAFCGINFSEEEVTSRALNAEFIPEINRYRNQPFVVEAAKKPAAPAASKPRLLSAYMNVPVESFQPASLDILSGLPYGAPARSKVKTSFLKAPPGVLVLENYAAPELCKKLITYADSMAGRKLEVVDDEKSTADKVVTQASSGRITDHVSINGMAAEVLTIFTDMHANRLAPYYGVTFEWFERPQILRYSAGGRYDPHADADHYDGATGQWMRAQDRDISVLLYLNEEYEGGEIGFDKLGFEIKPKAGMLLAFPSDHRYLHAARPTLSGLRYTIVSWAATVGSPRVKTQAPYASTFLHVP